MIVLFLIALFLAWPTGGLSIVAFIVFVVAKGYFKGKSRLHDANVRHAEKAINSGELYPPSWENDDSKIELFIGVVSGGATEKGVAKAFSVNLLNDPTGRKMMFWFAGALERSGASFIEQQMACIEKMVNVWKRSSADARKEMQELHLNTQPTGQAPERTNEQDELMSLLANGDMYGDGVDADEIPGCAGEFGWEATNPVPVKSVLGAREYLDSLRLVDGTKIEYNRIGSTTADGIKHPVDIFMLAHENGEEIGKLYFSPYHKRNSRKKPDFERLNSNSVPDTNVAITSPVEPMVEVQSIEGVKAYISKLSELTQEKVFVEFSNVMAAKHNLMFTSTSIDDYQEKQTKVTDLTDKALWICVSLFGQQAISKFNMGNPTRLNELINQLDEAISQKNLPPQQHGKQEEKRKRIKKKSRKK